MRRRGRRRDFDRFAFSEQENRHLGEDIEAAGGECLRDMRVRPGGSHHQKLVVLRHPGRPEHDVAFVGSIDLCHSRVVAQGWDLLANYPAMLLAAAGTLALTAVVVRSVRAARARLRYASWHLIHLYAYLGVGLPKRRHAPHRTTSTWP